ncbi:MAG: cupin domain-containing protein [Actinomycetota bacterium]|nr:cupin domain-containing protein [Actinomycetota bacterium]
MQIRRVVTGTSPDGKAFVASDDLVDPITVQLVPGGAFHRLWSSDDAATLPASSAQSHAPAYFPPPGGVRFTITTIAPMDEPFPPGIDIVTALEELEQKLPGMLAVADTSEPGMHTTDTIDFNFVASGEIWLELDGGAEVFLRTGDCVVMNGTRHAWRNKSEDPCVVVGTLLGARRRP